MNGQSDDHLPVIGSILHPTNLSAASEVAFAHALKAALLAGAKFTILHVGGGGRPQWKEFPGVRATLERWGVLPAFSPKEAVTGLGINVGKAIAREPDPVTAVLHYLESHPADLIVLGTGQHLGRMQWLQKSVARPVSDKGGPLALFVPEGLNGFVARRDGALSLRSVLVPVVAIPNPQPAVAAAARFVYRLQCPAGRFTVLHVGRPGEMPPVQGPEIAGWQWESVTQDGDITGTILDTARKTAADLIVMATEGRHGFLDALRGSHSERILRGSPCPLLAVPVGAESR